MGLDEIKMLPVPEITTDDAVLYLWATAPKLPQALEVMESWGFTYKNKCRLGQRQDRYGLLVAQPA